MKAVADTCWFIDMTKRHEGALGIARSMPELEIYLSEIVRGELYAGGRTARRIDELVGAFDVLPVDAAVARVWGETAFTLREKGLIVGMNDLWIAATALVHEMPILTRDAEAFRRVPRLAVIAY